MWDSAASTTCCYNSGALTNNLFAALPKHIILLIVSAVSFQINVQIKTHLPLLLYLYSINTYHYTV